MNKKELIGKINQLPSVLGWPGYGAKVMIAKDSVLELVRQLDEPQKVVIPPLIAGYIVHCQSYGMSLARVLTDIESSCEDHVAVNVQDWLSRQENQEAFVRAWLNGYEVEREKLYTVEIPNPNNTSKNVMVLRRLETGIELTRSNSKTYRDSVHCQLTEAEIRKDFEWAWQAGFAKEVE